MIFRSPDTTWQGNRQFANKLLRRIEMVSGTADLRIQQPFDEPHLHIDVDRTKAQLAGFTQRDVATNLLISLSGSFQTSPTYWLNPKNGVSYSIATQTPQYRVDSLAGRWRTFRSPAHCGASAGDSGHRWPPSSGAREWRWSRTTTFSR